jgi:hypothetical protein
MFLCVMGMCVRASTEPLQDGPDEVLDHRLGPVQGAVSAPRPCAPPGMEMLVDHRSTTCSSTLHVLARVYDRDLPWWGVWGSEA